MYELIIREIDHWMNKMKQQSRDHVLHKHWTQLSTLLFWDISVPFSSAYHIVTFCLQ